MWRGKDRTRDDHAQKALTCGAMVWVLAQAVRAFAADAGLSKSDVTDRVMNVVKGFNKVEASKVRVQFDPHWNAELPTRVSLQEVNCALGGCRGYY